MRHDAMPKFFPLRSASVSVIVTVLSNRMVRFSGVCVATYSFEQTSAVALSLLLTCTYLVYALYLSIYFSMPHPLCRRRLFSFRTDGIVSHTRIFLAVMTGGRLQMCGLRSREIAICRAHYSIRLWALTPCFQIKDEWQVISQYCASD